MQKSGLYIASLPRIHNDDDEVDAVRRVFGIALSTHLVLRDERLCAGAVADTDAVLWRRVRCQTEFRVCTRCGLLSDAAVASGSQPSDISCRGFGAVSLCKGQLGAPNLCGAV